MARSNYRGSLTATNLPFRTMDFGRTVINPGYDAAFSRQLGNESAGQMDSNLPQVYYAENVLPTNGGYKSVCQSLVAAAPSGTLVDSRVWRINDPLTGFILYLYTDNSAFRTLFVNKNGVYTAIGNPSIVTASRGGRLQNVFIVNGQIHLSFAGDIGANNAINIWTIDATTLALTVHPLTGFPYSPDALHFSVAGYICAISLTSAAWSSTVSLYDFTASLLTGAGSISVQDLQSSAIPVQAQGGAILVGTKNCVAMTFSNNARYPFTFQTITGSAGAIVGPLDLNVPGQRYIAAATDSSGCYTFNDFTIQRVALNAANSVFPELSDFFDADYIESLDLSNYIATRIAGQVVHPRLIKSLFSRYLVVVYHTTVNAVTTTWGLVFDSQLKRVGRIKFIQDVVEILEWEDSIAFVNPNGAIYTVNESGNGVHDGALLIGKFQEQRNSLITLQEVTFESVISTDPFTCQDLATLDGDTFLAPVTGYTDTATGTVRTFLFDQPGVNHTIAVRGKFDLNTVGISYVTEGMR